MRKAINKEHIEGKVYEHSLEVKTVKREDSENFGKEFIGGTLKIATDKDNTNIVDVYFPYVVEYFAKSGKKNNTYGVLKNIIESGKTVMKDGADAATLVKVDTSLNLNDFVSNRNGEETIVAAKRNEGGFVTLASSIDPDENKRTRFEFDILITGYNVVEADEEKNIDEDYGVIKGAVFTFNGRLLPVDLIVRSAGGMKYFESLDASPKNPTFTKVWGVITSKITKTKKIEESAFDDPVVREFTNTHREWLVTGANQPDKVYEIGKDITEDEIKQMIADREVHLADVKKQNEEYQARQKAQGGDLPFATDTNATAKEGGFNF